MSDTVLGAVIGGAIALVACISTQLLVHYLSLREDKVKRQRDEEQQRTREVRESRQNVSAGRLEDATKTMSIAGVRDITTPDIGALSGQVSLGQFDDVLAHLKASGKNGLACALAALKDAIEASAHLSPEQKQEAVQLVVQVAEEAAKSKPNKTLLKTLRDGWMPTLKAVVDVAEVAEFLGPPLAEFLSLET